MTTGRINQVVSYFYFALFTSLPSTAGQGGRAGGVRAVAALGGPCDVRTQLAFEMDGFARADGGSALSPTRAKVGGVRAHANRAGLPCPCRPRRAAASHSGA